MSVLSLRLPKTMHEQVKELASEEGISINQFVLLALSEKIAVLQASQYLEQRAKRSGPQHLLDILAAAPDVEPEPHDRLD
ncbi:MAG: toxin-antitoxin system HicB family antitoxin [Sphaerospermopsis sp. SIO1G2]|nr:toxin-antitoxin system HicB family antitoxin [Sphaerospermopsis sp. SIO1G2]